MKFRERKENEQLNSRERWRQRYPKASDEQLLQAQENLGRYFSVAWRVFLRLQQEGKLDEILTKARNDPKI